MVNIDSDDKTKAETRAELRDDGSLILSRRYQVADGWDEGGLLLSPRAVERLRSYLARQAD